MKAAPSAIRRPRDKRDNQLFGLLFTLPFILGFVFIFLYIFITAIRFSVSDMSLGQNGFELSFVWLENFRYALRGDPNYMRILLDALKNMLTTIPVVLIFSLFVAVVLNRQLPGRTFFRAVFFLPVVIYSGVLAMMQSNQIQDVTMSNITAEAAGEGTGILQINQMVAGLLGTLNLSGGLLDFVQTAVDRVQDITMASGVQILIFLAGLQTISPSLYEASTMEGATGWENFWKVTFPMISPIILVNAVYTIIDSMAGLNNPIIDKIYYESVVYGRHGPAAAMSWLYFLIISAVLLVFIAIASRKVYYEDAR